ncbi:MAG TPA: BadF/BadG/BcrA/BcrD ATPase family protein [Candidatus Limnocylindrales bacterium]|jgi:N-acetylglucosamine kinase-like BadF-type ATPase|nr:BadF/BadG/BcrA/BcrD ATPase family protein [Candidatus Limnocylindrales bacterium]
MTVVLAVDGGNSKTDVAVVDRGGRLLAAVRGPTSSHQAVGLPAGMERLAGLVADVTAQAGLERRPELAVYTLAGADTRADVKLLTEALAARGFAERDLIRNDAFGALRAGTDRSWGVVVICGHGVNAAGVAPNGRTFRLDALGDISGDWGGGTDVGWQALAGAVRARDGRGPRTRLERAVPAHFGLKSPAAVTSAMYRGLIPEARIAELSPVAFATAETGDAVARAVIDRLADEIVVMAAAMIRRLHLSRLDPDVVLGGGVFRTREPLFYERIRSGVERIAPAARLVRLAAPPVAGAALLGLDQLAGQAVPSEVCSTVRAAIGAWDAAVQRSVSGPPEASSRPSSARSGKPA